MAGSSARTGRGRGRGRGEANSFLVRWCLPFPACTVVGLRVRGRLGAVQSGFLTGDLLVRSNFFEFESKN
jgi:hypothetical protein